MSPTERDVSECDREVSVLRNPGQLEMLRHKEKVYVYTSRVKTKYSLLVLQCIYVFSCLAADIVLRLISRIMFLIEPQCSLLEVLTDKV